MPREIKYVVFNETFPVLFTPGQKHSDFKDVSGKITSAGMAEISFDKNENGEVELRVVCRGGSTSLKLTRDPNLDHELIKMMLVQTMEIPS